MLNLFVFTDTELVKYIHKTFLSKQTHKIIFK